MRSLLAALCLALPSLAAAQTATPGPGIPLEIADARAATMRGLTYHLQMRIPDALTAPIEGRNSMVFELTAANAPLVIDFATSREHVKRVSANGREVPIVWTNGHIVVPADSLTAGHNQVVVDFVAGDASLNRNADFLYALFVPARAHLAIPCFDQPNLKARWTLQLDSPAKWQAVSNGAEVDRLAQGGRLRIRFAETEPLSTYLFSFVVGDFKIETAERSGRTFRMFHRETDAAKLARNKDAVFDLHARALEYLEQYTAIPYPFGKFDFVLIPAFQFGGMEHAGKILYNASGLLLDASATQNQHLGRASVIAHETAHMWFGDLVTMRWFSDVWMKEVFANFMAAKIVNPSFPEVNHELRFLLSHYPSAYEVDRTRGTNAIRQPLANLNEAGSLYGAIIYQKAPVIMRHLEHLMGETAFRDGLREYLKTYSFRNATWPDLIAILDARTPSDLAQWSRVWVEERGRPTIRTTLRTGNGRIEALTFEQLDATWKRPLAWPQDLRITLGYEGRTEQLEIRLDGARADAKQAIGRPAPLFVLPSGGGWAYGRFALDRRSIEYLTTSLPAIGDPLTRGAAWVTLWEEMLEGETAAPTLVDLAMLALPSETDEQLTQRVLGYVRNAWWKFLRPGERSSRQEPLEALLRRGLDAARTPSQKSAWFGALRDVAMGRDTVQWLQRVWEKKEEVPGLPLAEADYSALAQDLAVREVTDWRAILKTQLDRIENPDRKARFAFVIPSLSADPAERERWFLALADVDNRRQEPWVLDGLGHLHHPLRAAASMRFVQRSLEMLQEIQRTGDIFFPTRWMNTTLSGHNSPEVASSVEKFLAGLPAGYPDRLRNIILQAADELVRAAAMMPAAGAR
jgi:aminopeptidase N